MTTFLVPRSRTNRRLAVGILWLLSWSAIAQAEDEWLDFVNPLLGPEYTQWLVGPLRHLASREEADEYLRLADDEQAARFIGAFWQGPRAKWKRVFDERVAEADRRYGESAYPGSRTDRGTIFTLYGEPEEIRFEEFRDVRDPAVELWEYPKGGEPGLDGKRPNRTYRFTKDGDLTRLFSRGGANDPDRRRRRLPNQGVPRFPPR